MPKRAVSVTLEAENLLWLKGRAQATQARGVSEMLDAIVTEARLGGSAPTPSRSVVGTVDIASHDPDLSGADAAVAEMIAASLARPVLVRESAPPYGPARARAKRRG